MLNKWSQFYYHDFNPALVIPKCRPRGDTDLQPASSSDLSSPDLPITVSLEELLLKTDVTMCHESWYVVSGQLYRKYVSWRNTLRSKPLFSPPLYFQSKEVTTLHAPHAWDAREPQRMGVPHDGRAQCLGYTQRPRTWGKWGNHLPNHPVRSPLGLLQGKTETKEAITVAPYSHQDSKI